MVEEPTIVVDVAVPEPAARPTRIPNGNVGKPFACDLSAVTTLPAGDLEISDPLPDGLSLNADALLRGAPTSAGEYRLRWHSKESDLSGEILITIIADPRSLWQNHPSDRTDPDWKVDTDRNTASSEVARVAVASVRGRSHAHVGLFRDDDFAMYVPRSNDPQGWHLVCVADGAGSAKASRKGSQIACREMISKLKELLVDAPAGSGQELNTRAIEACEADKGTPAATWHRLIHDVLSAAAHHAQTAVRQEAEKHQRDIKDYSTTLLAAIVRRTRKGVWFVGTYWVGDGAIGMWKDGWEKPKVFGEPDSGEFAGQTMFFTSEDFSRSDLIARRVRYTIVEEFDCLALMTDGISDPKFPTEQQLKQAQPWREFISDLGSVLEPMRRGEADAASHLQSWMDFWSTGNHDDRTLLLLVPRPKAGGR